MADDVQAGRQGGRRGGGPVAQSRPIALSILCTAKAKEAQGNRDPSGPLAPPPCSSGGRTDGLRGHGKAGPGGQPTRRSLQKQECRTDVGVRADGGGGRGGLPMVSACVLGTWLRDWERTRTEAGGHSTGRV